LLSLTFAVSLGRIQEERQRGAIKLITNLTIKPLRGTAGFVQQRRYPRDESKLNTPVNPSSKGECVFNISDFIAIDFF